MGLHKKLTRDHGDHYAATDEYYEKINSRMREKFPEYFGERAEPETYKKPATVGGGFWILDFGCWAHGESRTFRGARVKEAHSTA